MLNHNVESRRKMALKREYADYLGILAVFAGGKTLKIDGKFMQWTRTRGCPGYDKVMKALSWGTHTGRARFVNHFTYEIDIGKIPSEYRKQLPKPVERDPDRPHEEHADLRLPSSVIATAAPEPKVKLRPSIAQVLDIVSVHFGVRVDELVGPSQARHITRPRLVAYYLGHVHLGIGQRVVGMHIGRRKQSAVSLGITRLQQDMRMDLELKANVQNVLQKLKE